ncbi:hypothetical protein F750_0496 [Streptomyces sp. PAMC 26508]|nr:hypothetical protein F750_0496 [Streptomyces sp. PAMC 26508]
METQHGRGSHAGDIGSQAAAHTYPRPSVETVSGFLTSDLTELRAGRVVVERRT